MFRGSRFRQDLPVGSSMSLGAIGALLAGSVFFNIVANASFKASADGRTWREFLVWQVVGNLAGFATVLILTGLLRYLPLQVAYPVTTGLSVIGVQVVAAWLLFHQRISPLQWIGTLLIVAGILCIWNR
jgi:multidrug transporter EmrE-like cation transporter